MDIQIRLERPVDYRETEHVTREAFWNQYSPGCNEHFLLHVMRDCPVFLPELDFVAVYAGRIVGNVVCTKAVLKGDDGKDYTVLGLGPISVLPEYQRQGVGGALIEHTKASARAQDYRAIFLYGDPAYYSRQGFVPAENLGIRTSDNMYAAALQVCELKDEALAGIHGRYLEDPVFAVDALAAAEFDKHFPVRKMLRDTPSQRRFEEIVSQRKQVR